MRARNQCRQERLREMKKESLEFLYLFSREDGESGRWSALMPVERGGYSPDTAFPVRAFLQLRVLELLEGKRRIGNDGMESIGSALAQPRNTVRLNKFVGQVCSLLQQDVPCSV